MAYVVVEINGKKIEEGWNDFNLTGLSVLASEIINNTDGSQFNYACINYTDSSGNSASTSSFSISSRSFDSSSGTTTIVVDWTNNVSDGITIDSVTICNDGNSYTLSTYTFQTKPTMNTNDQIHITLTYTFS